MNMKLNLKTIYFLLLIGLFTQACQVKWITDYDSEMVNEIVEVAKDVDSYYAKLLSLTDDNGEIQFTEEYPRKSFEAFYQDIDSDLYGIMLKNQSKSLNTYSTEISKSILQNYWRKYKGDLNSKETILQIHRNNFTKNFEALLKAEKAKNETN